MSKGKINNNNSNILQILLHKLIATIARIKRKLEQHLKIPLSLQEKHMHINKDWYSKILSYWVAASKCNKTKNICPMETQSHSRRAQLLANTPPTFLRLIRPHFSRVLLVIDTRIATWWVIITTKKVTLWAIITSKVVKNLVMKMNNKFPYSDNLSTALDSLTMTTPPTHRPLSISQANIWVEINLNNLINDQYRHYNWIINKFNAKQMSSQYP